MNTEKRELIEAAEAAREALGLLLELIDEAGGEAAEWIDENGAAEHIRKGGTLDEARRALRDMLDS